MINNARNQMIEDGGRQCPPI